LAETIAMVFVARDPSEELTGMPELVTVGLAGRRRARPAGRCSPSEGRRACVSADRRGDAGESTRVIGATAARGRAPVAGRAFAGWGASMRASDGKWRRSTDLVTGICGHGPSEPGAGPTPPDRSSAYWDVIEAPLPAPEIGDYVRSPQACE
jgi:hypothetical protein